MGRDSGKSVKLPLACTFIRLLRKTGQGGEKRARILSGILDFLSGPAEPVGVRAEASARQQEQEDRGRDEKHRGFNTPLELGRNPPKLAPLLKFRVVACREFI